MDFILVVNIIMGVKMSDGNTLYCPDCGTYTALNKEYDKIDIKLKLFSIKHPDDDVWYDSYFPVYTCSFCKKKWAIERVT